MGKQYGPSGTLPSFHCDWKRERLGMDIRKCECCNVVSRIKGELWWERIIRARVTATVKLLNRLRSRLEAIDFAMNTRSVVTSYKIVTMTYADT